MSANSQSTTSKSKQKYLEADVHFLDSTKKSFTLPTRALGQELYDMVVEHLQLVEYDYFDLEYMNKHGSTFWLDHMKPIQKQCTSNKEYQYTFSVKFYTPHPNLLEDEFTRYLFALQIKKDLYLGRLPCSESTAALLAAFIVQARIGDFLEDVYVDHSYLHGMQLFPSTTVEFLRKVVECHRNLVGQSPAEADCNLLDTVRKVEHYGIHTHPAKDSAGLKLGLAVAHLGIIIYQGNAKVNSFSWARIRKLSFKRKRFIVKLHPETYHAEEYVFESRDECKSFWKQCIEHHAFFRCQAVKKPQHRRGRMVSKGSSFRYTGRTQKQLIEYVRENYVKMPPFERSSSTGRVFNTQLPPALITGLQLNQSAMVVGTAGGPRGETGVQSDLGPTTRLITQIRPQTDPAQRNHLTDSQLPSDANNRALAMGIPVFSDQQLASNGRQTVHGISVRQRRSCSMASEAPMTNTLPRGAYLLSTAGTASSGSYTMNSSLSADSPAQSNSSAGSPQVDRKQTTLPDYPAHFVMPSQLRMQDLTLRPLSVASLGPVGQLPPGTVPFTQATWRTALSRPASPNPPGVLLAQQSGGRPLGVAVLPTDPYSAMQASLLVNPKLGGLPVLAMGSNANATVGPNAPATTVAAINARISSVPTAFSVAGAAVQSIRNLRLPSDPTLSDPARFGSARLNLPPGYALLAGAAPATLGGRVIYIDRNTGRPLWSVLTTAGGGQFILDNNVPVALRPSSVSGVTLPQQPQLSQRPISVGSPQHPGLVSSVEQPKPAVSEAPPLVHTPLSGPQVSRTISQEAANLGALLRSRHPGPQPPERRESMLPRPSSTPSQHSLEGDANRSSRSPQFSQNPTDRPDMLDSGAEDDGSGSPQSGHSSQRALHPLAIGLITGPNGVNSASCLSLAARGRSALSRRSLFAADSREASDADDTDDARDRGSQSDFEKVNQSQRSSVTSKDGEEDADEDDHRSVCSQRSQRSRSASCRHNRHRHHHHRQQATRCQSAVDPSMGSVSDISQPSIPTGSGQESTAIGNTLSHVSMHHHHHHHHHSVRRSYRHHTDGAYQLICDLVMTERTYGKDLSVICERFRSPPSAPPEEIAALSVPPSSHLPEDTSLKLFTLLDPVYGEHQKLLVNLEARLTSWVEKRNKKTSDESSVSIPPNGEAAESTETVYRVGDLFVENMRMLPLYQNYLNDVEHLILDIEAAIRVNPILDEVMRNFEAQKFCYLPFYVFLLKPMHRLLQYRVTLERLMRHYGETHPDAPNCRIAHARLLDLIQSQWESYKRVENIHKLLEIQRDLVGLRAFPQISDAVDKTPNGDISITNTSASSTPWGPLLRLGRQFIREGWLQKLSKKGYQPRIFFLFSDQLVYASRTATACLQFKVHGQFQLHDLMIEEAEPAHSFTVFSGNRCFLVAAPSDWQRDRWLEDISRAILAAKTKPTSSMDADASFNMMDSKLSVLETSEATDTSQILQRVTTSVHVCWHRSFTYSMQDILRANEYQTSGYLLRKFKNSNGWQRLWVVFTQNCLFFYKSYRDDCPLASLPLLGYIITTPGADDQIRRDNVIKMQFKNHVYFFRGETHHSFEKWFEYLSCATGTSRRLKT